MRLFDVMSALVVGIGTLVGGVIALLEPHLASSISVGFFLSLLSCLGVAVLGSFNISPYTYMGVLLLCNGASAFIAYRANVYYSLHFVPNNYRMYRK